jgi:cob(I)alamin adenosyltransferase
MLMAAKIYTRTGDKGKTSLIGGTKVPKSHERIEAYGTVDELNSYIGLVGDLLKVGAGASAADAGAANAGAANAGAADDGLAGARASAAGAPVPGTFPESALVLLRGVQDRLFAIGASLACDPEKEVRLKIPDLNDEDVTLLEIAMDEMNDLLPAMTNFILPGGHPAVSSLHVARCVCRRAERSVVWLEEHGEFVEMKVVQYLNRLSDYLFVLARFTAYQWRIPEVKWVTR